MPHNNRTLPVCERGKHCKDTLLKEKQPVTFWTAQQRIFARWMKKTPRLSTESKSSSPVANGNRMLTWFTPGIMTKAHGFPKLSVGAKRSKASERHSRPEPTVRTRQSQQRGCPAQASRLSGHPLVVFLYSALGGFLLHCWSCGRH
jgi:hypothetical protein